MKFDDLKNPPLSRTTPASEGKIVQPASLSIKRNMLWNSFGSLVYLGCQWLVTVLVARLSFGYDSAGVLAIAMAVSNVFAPMALYKIRAYQVSDVQGKMSSGEYIAFRFLTITGACVIIALYVALTCKPETFLPVALYLAFRGGDIFIDVLHGIDQQNYRMDYCGKSLGIRGILFLAAFTAVFGLTNNLSLALAAMICVTYPVIAYDIRQARRFEPLRPKISASSAKNLARECLPAVLGTVCFMAVTSIARQMLGSTHGEEALGIYASVCTPAVIIQAGADYIYIPLLRLFAERYHNKQAEEFRSLFLKVTFAILALLVVCLIGFFLFGRTLLTLAFGPSIVPYAYLLYPALVCVVLTAYVEFLGDLLIAVRMMRGNLIGNAIALVFSIPCSVICISIWDMNGVSFSISACYLLASAIMIFLLVKRTANHFKSSDSSRSTKDHKL